MDKEIKCVDCNSYFAFTERDQDFYRKQWYQDPKRCFACRQAKKSKYENNKNNYKN